MLPDIPELRDSLEGLEVIEIEPQEVKNHRQSVLLSDQFYGTAADGSHVSNETFLLLQQNRPCPISAAKLVRRVADELAKCGHAYMEQTCAHREHVAATFLAAAVLCRTAGASQIDALDRAIAAIKPFRLAQWTILAGKPMDGSQCHIGPFTYSRLDARLLKDRCRRADLLDWTAYADKCSGRAALFRDIPELMMSDLRSVAEDAWTAKTISRLQLRALSEYYVAISLPAWDSFFRALAFNQAVYGAAGVRTFPLALEREQVVSDWVAVFTRSTRGGGWVLANRKLPMSPLTEPEILERKLNEVDRHLGLDKWGQLPLDQHIQKFASYVSTARDLRDEGRFEESLLHVVFAMDLLLGGDPGEPLTKVVSERTAVLASVAVDRGYQETVKVMQECYDLRSGYAHRGERGSAAAMQMVNHVDSLLKMAAVVLAAACFARRQEWAKEKDARKAWIKRIDLIRAHLAAGFPREQIQGVDLGLERIELTPVASSPVSIRW